MKEGWLSLLSLDLFFLEPSMISFMYFSSVLSKHLSQLFTLLLMSVYCLYLWVVCDLLKGR